MNTFANSLAIRPSAVRIACRNESGETAPPYAVVQFDDGDGDAMCMIGTKPSDSGTQYALNTEKPMESSGDAQYGEVVIPTNCVAWAYYTDEDPPPVAWESEVGPVADQWNISNEGSGFVYAGVHDTDKERILVMKLSGSSSVIYGIVRDDLGCGYYIVEKATWDGVTPTDGDGEGVGSRDEVSCDICPSTGSGADCGAVTISDFVNQHTGNGTMVLAYDSASTVVPLQLDTDCLMVKTGAKNASVGLTLDPEHVEEEEDNVYQIVRGHQTHTVQYIENQICCDGEILRTERKAVIFAAKICENEFCNEDCP